MGIVYPHITLDYNVSISPTDQNGLFSVHAQCNCQLKQEIDLSLGPTVDTFSTVKRSVEAFHFPADTGCDWCHVQSTSRDFNSGHFFAIREAFVKSNAKLHYVS